MMTAIKNSIKKIIPDKVYLEILYKRIFGKKLNLKNPQTFNEKLQWLKLYDRKDIYTTMVDKYEVKKYISNIIGDEYIIPTIGIYNKFDDIDFEQLPNKFVIKCTHDSGSTIICKNKNEFDIEKNKVKINKFLKTNFYYNSREWPYKNVKPRIIIEKYMEDDNVGDIIDYKIYSFNGKCNYVMVCTDRMIGETKFLFYDKNWILQKDMTKDGLKYGDSINIDKPQNLDKMFELASKLSENIPFVRVDFYEVNSKIYFGELTFFPSAGFDAKRLKKTDDIFSSLINLGDVK